MPSRLNPDSVIECVPNFSEGADAAKVAQIIAAMKVEGVRLLDWTLDAAHNRSVVTIAGSPWNVTTHFYLSRCLRATDFRLTWLSGRVCGSSLGSDLCVLSNLTAARQKFPARTFLPGCGRRGFHHERRW